MKLNWQQTDIPSSVNKGNGFLITLGFNWARSTNHRKDEMICNMKKSYFKMVIDTVFESMMSLKFENCPKIIKKKLANTSQQAITCSKSTMKTP